MSKLLISVNFAHVKDWNSLPSLRDALGVRVTDRPLLNIFVFIVENRDEILFFDASGFESDFWLSFSEISSLKLSRGISTRWHSIPMKNFL